MVGCSVCAHMRSQGLGRGSSHDCAPYVLARLDVVRGFLRERRIRDAFATLISSR